MGQIPTLRFVLTTGSRKERARKAVMLATPVGVELVMRARRSRRLLREIEASTVREMPPAETRAQEAIRFLVHRGLEEHAVRAGSIPEDSLDYIRAVVSRRLPSGRPLRALQIGNFVGMSLCYFSWLVRERHPASVVVSVDPNITHRRVDDPQRHVFALLHHFGLLENNLIIPGYSLEQTTDTVNERLENDYLDNLGCWRVLAALATLCGACFDLVVLDGNHDEGYLERELTVVGSLLARDGLVVLDDVSARWDAVTKVFARATEDEGYAELGNDGRVGILQAVDGRPSPRRERSFSGRSAAQRRGSARPRNRN